MDLGKARFTQSERVCSIIDPLNLQKYQTVGTPPSGCGPGSVSWTRMRTRPHLSSNTTQGLGSIQLIITVLVTEVPSASQGALHFAVSLNVSIHLQSSIPTSPGKLPPNGTPNWAGASVASIMTSVCCWIDPAQIMSEN